MRGRFTAIVLVLRAVTACEEVYEQPVVVAMNPTGAGGGNSAGGAPPAGSSAVARIIPPPTCSGRCCPKAPGCYPAMNPSPYSGAECLAQRDNTNQPHWQLRQTLSVSVNPPGLKQSGIANILATRSALKSDTCGATNGGNGFFMQLIDFDPAARISRTGFARFSADQASALSTSLCFVQEDAYSDTMFALPKLYDPPVGWPKGLAAPMPMPWKVQPVTATQLDQDFTLPADRETLLARLDATGDLAAKGNGVFYFDPAKGYMHGYSPITYIVNYDTATQYNAVPIREAEITQWFNDPAHPNCSGAYLGDNSLLPASCEGDATNRVWGCPAGNCAPTELGATKITGYFLIAELEQIGTIGQTLCNLFASGMYPGWTISPSAMSCRSDPHWNPLDPVNGIPHGDWCATRNAPASGDCHDAWQSVSYASFQAFPIKDGVCPAI